MSVTTRGTPIQADKSRVITQANPVRRTVGPNTAILVLAYICCTPQPKDRASSRVLLVRRASKTLANFYTSPSRRRKSLSSRMTAASPCRASILRDARKSALLRMRAELFHMRGDTEQESFLEEHFRRQDCHSRKLLAHRSALIAVGTIRGRTQPAIHPVVV
jgi:hypothetical protein